MKAENGFLYKENAALCRENQLLKNDNERMKRILNNDSTNSGMPPSTEQPGKVPNTYNNRKTTKNKAGAQPGHKGRHLSKADVEKKIQDGVFEHRLKEIGIWGREYVTRYCLDFEVETVATEIRIYADENEKFQIPEEYKADVFYGDNIKAAAAFQQGVSMGFVAALQKNVQKCALPWKSSF